MIDFRDASGVEEVRSVCNAHTNLDRCPNIDDIIILFGRVNFTHHNKKLHSNPGYWDLVEGILSFIENGLWPIDPESWGVYLKRSNVHPLNPSEVLEFTNEHKQHIFELKKRLNIPPGRLSNKRLLLKWSTNENGWRGILGLSRVLIAALDNEIYTIEPKAN